MIRPLSCLLLLNVCLLTSGCGIRPKESNTYVVVEAGDPAQVIDLDKGKGEKVIVKCKTMKGGTIANQDITGWIAMPPSHWRVIADKLNPPPGPTK